MKLDAASFEFRIARQALLEWMRSKAPMDRVLGDTLREHRVGAGQRAAIVNAAYTMVRFWPLLVDHDFAPEIPAKLRAFESSLEMALNTNRETILKRHESASPAFAQKPLEHLQKLHRIAPFLLQEMRASDLGAWHSFLHQMLDEAPLSVRVNLLKTDAKQFAARFKDSNPQESLFVPGCFYFDRRVPLHVSDEFKDGLFEIQDEHSQMISLIADPKPGERVLDMCAGAGGKTLHMSQLMKGKGEIVSYDLAKSKITELMIRARRSGATNVRAADSLLIKEKFDLIVVDAPCSGLGTLRRTPDRLMRFDDSESKQLASVQRELLRKALTLVNPGGRIVYATCTVRPQENWQVIAPMLEASGKKGDPFLPTLEAHLGAQACAKFLSAVRETPAFQIAETFTTASLPARANNATPSEISSRGYLQWGPSISQTSGGLGGDGFFVARVK